MKVEIKFPSLTTNIRPMIRKLEDRNHASRAMITRSNIVKVVFLSVTLLLMRGSYAAEPWTPVPSSFFGMHINCNGYNGTSCGSFNWPTVPIGSLGKPSCSGWPYIEPSRGTYNWAALDQYVTLAQQHNVDFIYTIGGVPSWALSNQSFLRTVWLQRRY